MLIPNFEKFVTIFKMKIHIKLNFADIVRYLSIVRLLLGNENIVFSQHFQCRVFI